MYGLSVSAKEKIVKVTTTPGTIMQFDLDTAKEMPSSTGSKPKFISAGGCSAIVIEAHYKIFFSQIVNDKGEIQANEY